MNTTKIANIILKEADLVHGIKRILDLNLDDQIVSKGQKLLNLLDKLEISEESTLIEKQDFVAVKEKIRKSMETFQESMEDLFSMHERLVRESEMS